MIDPGHGGKDPGCVSKDNKTYEKTITLDIGKTLAEKIREAYPDVKVVMTRETDVYVTLDERAAIANEADADLFISIHINANTSSAPSGYSVHVLGQSSNKNRDLFANNMDVCIRENSVIMLEDDYNTKYQGFDPANPESYIFMMLMQNAYLEQSLRFAEQVHSNLEGGPITKPRGMSQDPFYVLWKTSMPAVLLELGFMSNASDLEKLRDKSNRDELAGKIFEAFGSYKNVYDESINLAKYDDTPAPSTTSTYFASTSSTSSPRSSSTLSRGYTPPVLLPEITQDSDSQSGTNASSGTTAGQTSTSTTTASTSETSSASSSTASTTSSASSSELSTAESSATSSTRITSTTSRTRITTPPPVLLPEPTENTPSQASTNANSGTPERETSTIVASTSETSSTSSSAAAATASSSTNYSTSSETGSIRASTENIRLASNETNTSGRNTSSREPFLISGSSTTDNTDVSSSSTTENVSEGASATESSSQSAIDKNATDTSTASAKTEENKERIEGQNKVTERFTFSLNTSETSTAARSSARAPRTSQRTTTESRAEYLFPSSTPIESSEPSTVESATATATSSTYESSTVEVVSEISKDSEAIKVSDASETTAPSVSVSEIEIKTEKEETAGLRFSSDTSGDSGSTYMGATLTPNSSSSTLTAPKINSDSAENPSTTPTLSFASRTNTSEAQTSSPTTNIVSSTTETASPATSESSSTNSSSRGLVFTPTSSEASLTVSETGYSATQTQTTTESESSLNYNARLWESSNTDDTTQERVSPPGAVSNASSARRSTSSTTSANRSQSQNSNWESTTDETSDQATIYYSSRTPSSSSMLRTRISSNSSSEPVYLIPSMALNSEEVGKTERSHSGESIGQKPSERGQAEAWSAKVEYGVQIFATKKPQEDKSLFLGYTPKIIYDSGIGVYKHIIALSESKEKTRESLNEIKINYHDAFLVEIRDGRITRVR